MGKYIKIIFLKWGRQILGTEQNINIKQRLLKQKEYTIKLPSGERALVMQWKQKVKIFLIEPEELINFNLFITKENERSQAKNIWGYFECVKKLYEF